MSSAQTRDDARGYGLLALVQAGVYHQVGLAVGLSAGDVRRCACQHTGRWWSPPQGCYTQPSSACAVRTAVTCLPNDLPEIRVAYLHAFASNLYPRPRIFRLTFHVLFYQKAPGMSRVVKGIENYLGSLWYFVGSSLQSRSRPGARGEST